MRLSLSLLILVLMSLTVTGQNRGTDQSGMSRMLLTGVVYDINGAVIVDGTKVVAYGPDGKEYVTATNDEGVYKFELPFTTYKIDVTAPGFCTARVVDFIIVNSTNGKMSLDFVLEVRGGRCKHDSIQKKQPKRKSKKDLYISLE